MELYGSLDASNMADGLATGTVLMFMVQILNSPPICMVRIDHSVNKLITMNKMYYCL